MFWTSRTVTDMPYDLYGHWKEPKVTGFVYVLLFPSGETYVGYTTQTLEQRWNNGKAYIYASNKWMRQAVIETPWDRIKKYAVHIADEKHGWFAESLLIAALNSVKEGLNVSEGHFAKAVNKTSAQNFIKRYPKINDLYRCVLREKDAIQWKEK